MGCLPQRVTKDDLFALAFEGGCRIFHATVILNRLGRLLLRLWLEDILVIAKMASV